MLAPEIAGSLRHAKSAADRIDGPAARTKHLHPIRGLRWHILALLVLLPTGALYVISGHQAFGIPAAYESLASHFLAAILVTALILAAEKATDLFIARRNHDDSVTLFNLRLVLRLVTMLLVGLVLLSAISQTWYTVPVALGAFSLVIGFALQMPMTSLIGWIYILVRAPYRVGDRIKIADATGDVIDVSYFDTTLWEFGGQYLSTDHPSGRVIKFPNSTVLNTPVYNYSWSQFPYIWDEIRFNVAYDSDLDFVAETMNQAAMEEVGESMAERVRAFRGVLDNTPVDQLEVREEPTVFFRVNGNLWLDAVVRYLVDPKEAGRIKTVILRKMLLRLNVAPDRVRFPKGR